MVKKIIPIIFSLLLLALATYLPSFLSDEVNNHLLMYDSNSLYTQRTKYKTNKDFSLFEKIDFICLYGTNKNRTLALEDSEDIFDVELYNGQIESLYQQINKLCKLNGIVDISIDNLEQYHNCKLNVYTYNNTILSIYNVIILLPNRNIIVDVWCDSETFEIYQYSMIDGNNEDSLADYEVEKAMMNYLNIDQTNFNKYYKVHHDDINVRVELLKTIQK